MSLTKSRSPVNLLSPLGYKVFLDRFSQKDLHRETIQKDDLVLVCVDKETGNREIGIVEGLSKDSVRVSLFDLYTGEISKTDNYLKDEVDKPLELYPEDMMDRIVKGVVQAEKEELRPALAMSFRNLLEGWKFVPGGRIMTSVGTTQKLTAYNCYVIPSPHDSREGIFKSLSVMTEIFSRGGGVGINLSSLRHRFAYVRGVNGRSGGSVSWGQMFSYATGIIEQGGSRRGALLLGIDCWHPDVFEWVNAKKKEGVLSNANISVIVSDAFLKAVDNDEQWNLEFPDTSYSDYNSVWDGDLDKWKKSGLPVTVYKTVSARKLWNEIVSSAWESSDPGVLFLDTYNRLSNSYYYSKIRCSNPCGEQGLSIWGNCLLGSINLPKFLNSSCTDMDWELLQKSVITAVRFLDNVIEVTPYFFKENEERQKKERRIGLGTMGLADLMIRLKIRYGSRESLYFVDRLYKFIAENAYLASVSLAQEKGSFSYFDSEKYLKSEYVQNLSVDVRDMVSKFGIRNVTLLSQAPTGDTGTMMNTSTGMEPYFQFEHVREGRIGKHEVVVPVYKDWKDSHPDEKTLPPYFVSALELDPEEHVRMQAAVQKWIDSGISKTHNIPKNYTVDQVDKIFRLMHSLGCKGGTVHRQGAKEKNVLSVKENIVPISPLKSMPPQSHCKRPGETYTIETPVGNLHFTINSLPGQPSEPFDCFLRVGKGGHDLEADAEAIGRLISVLLRIRSDVSGLEKLRMIYGQLSRIGGSSQTGFGKDRVSSFPDAIAKIIYTHLKSVGSSPAEVLIQDICPNCHSASLIYEEGCKRCHSCGHSLC
jgi:ribonucleoside-diphosphate reductase alpha chain